MTCRYGYINTHSQAKEMKAVLQQVLTELAAGGRLKAGDGILISAF